LADICEIRPAKRQCKEILSDDDVVSFLPMEDLRSDRLYTEANTEKPLGDVYKGYTYFADGDVLLAKITPCFQNGKLAVARNLVNGVGFGSSEYFVFRAGSRLLPEFLYYFFSRQSFRDDGVAQMGGAVGHQRVPKEFLEALLVPLPPLPEQKRIVAILDEAFASIDQAKANTERNLANARELFDSYLSRVFEEKGERWESMQIGELVENGILEKPLDGNHGEIHPKKADFVDVGVPFIMASDLKNGLVDQENCNFIRSDQAKTLRKGFAKDQDVLLSHKGTIGRTSILACDSEYVVLTPQVTYYRISNRSRLFNKYLYWFFQSPFFQDQMLDIAGRGSTRAYIGITKQLTLTINLPSLEVQENIVRGLSNLTARISGVLSNYELKHKHCSELKQSILKKAFSGELTNKPDKVLNEVGL
jgi:type I restriction enzyme S subunit